MKTGIITLELLLEKMAIAPRRVFGIAGGYIEDGQLADLAVLDLNREYTIDPDTFLSMGKSTPFAGMNVWGENTATFVGGKKVWEKDHE